MFLNKSLEDEKFGTLKLSRLSPSAWHGKAGFEPTGGGEIHIYISDLGNPGSNLYKDFYRELELKYSTFVEEIADLLHRTYLEAGGVLARHDVRKKFKLSTVTFPRAEFFIRGSFEWALGYSYAPGMDNFGIEMDSWSPAECYAGESPIS